MENVLHETVNHSVDNESGNKNTKHYAKERIKKSNNVNDDDDEEKLDHTNFQEIFCNITDDLVEEDDNN